MAFDVAHERNVAQGLAHRALQESDQLDPLSDLVATTERLLTRWREHGADVTEGVALLDAVRDVRTRPYFNLARWLQKASRALR